MQFLFVFSSFFLPIFFVKRWCSDSELVGGKFCGAEFGVLGDGNREVFLERTRNRIKGGWYFGIGWRIGRVSGPMDLTCLLYFVLSVVRCDMMEL